VVGLTPRPLYPQGKSPSYPLDRRLGGPQSQSGRGECAHDVSNDDCSLPYRHLSIKSDGNFLKNISNGESYIHKQHGC
jgi:hypothetical protein